ncbi:MAG: Per1-like-domain-containing protein [Monoraphidium minutum]|nr:MAG: Per1-like-domain-containing protein [Monoraphidium minutum]
MPRRRTARAPAPLKLALLPLLLAAAAPRAARASEGDASPAFRACAATCQQTGCLPPDLQRWSPETAPASDAPTPAPAAGRACALACPQNAPAFVPPPALRAARWDCAADCAYHCMWAEERRRAAAREGPIWKYFGKWPFVRVLGAQEIASVALSAANLAAHAGAGTAAATAAGAAPGGAYPYAWTWWLYGGASANAWLWSCVFHVRDTRTTERLDYFSADFLVASGLLVALTRTLRLTARRRLLPAAAAVGLGLLYHIHFMAFVKFDYGYNMAVCIAAGVATAAAWVGWAAAARHPARSRAFAFIAAVHAAMALEVLDFPPAGGLLDAHALWHAATAPLTLIWYSFVCADVAWVAGGGGGDSSGSGGTSSGASGGGVGSGGGASGSGAAARAASPAPGGRRRAAPATVEQGKRDS